MKSQLFNFTHFAFEGVRSPRMSGADPLKLCQILSLVNLRSGVIHSLNGELLSVPFTLERGDEQFSLRSHFPAFRKNLIAQIENEAELEVLFTCGEYYVDPEWVLRENHAPTEIKVVFSVRGAARFVDCTQEEAIAHLDRVTQFRQMLFQPSSQFSVWQLPDDYYAEQLPQILQIEIDVEEVAVSQVMALLHLIPEHRSYLMQKLDQQTNPQARFASLIMHFFLLSTEQLFEALGDCDVEFNPQALCSV